MTALGWAVTSVAAVLGLGGGGALLFFGLGPIGAVFAGASWLKAGGKILAFLFVNPVGRMILVIAAVGLAYLYGHHVGSDEQIDVCQRRIDASVAAAAQFDAQAAAAQHAASLQQIADADARVADATKRIDDYARTHQSCSIGAAGADMLGGLSDALQPGQPQPAGDGRRGPGKAGGATRPGR